MVGSAVVGPWLTHVVAASAVGKSHLTVGKPCEDAFCHVTAGRWTSAVVCDGCGSAEQGGEGAALIARWFATALVGLGSELDERGPGDWTVDRVIGLIVDLRQTMRDSFGADLLPYSATIVAAMQSDTSGFLVHVGDGIGTAFDLSPLGEITVRAQSDPENGEYINQTFYVTEGNWLRHLRITPFTGAQGIILATDGGQPLLYDGVTLDREALLPLLSVLFQDDATPTEALDAFIGRPEVARLTNDDVTIALLLSENAERLARNLSLPLRHAGEGKPPVDLAGGIFTGAAGGVSRAAGVAPRPLEVKDRELTLTSEFQQSRTSAERQLVRVSALNWTLTILVIVLLCAFGAVAIIIAMDRWPNLMPTLRDIGWHPHPRDQSSATQVTVTPPEASETGERNRPPQPVSSRPGDTGGRAPSASSSAVLNDAINRANKDMPGPANGPP